MYDDYEIPKRRLSEEDVMAILAEEHRRREHISPESGGVKLISFDSTVAEYEKTFDVPQRIPTLARNLNRFFEMNIERELCDTMHPPRERTLRDVCRLVASRNYEQRALLPVQIFGSECAAAGAFVTLKALLKEAGADVSEVAPSTSLAEYARRYTGAFHNLALMAPGKLPLTHVKHDLDIPLLLVFVLYIATAVASLWYWSFKLFCITGGFGLLLLALAAAMANVLPREVRFGEFKTFRDLCRAITR